MKSKLFKNRLPIEVHEYLELIGFDRCMALRSLQTLITPYYEQCKSQMVKMASDLVVCNSVQQDMTYVIIQQEFTPRQQIFFRFHGDPASDHCDCVQIEESYASITLKHAKF